MTIKRFFILFLAIIALNILASKSFAQDIKQSYYKSMTVDLIINEDSTVTVEEEMTINYLGTFRGTSRSITLSDDETYQKCKKDPLLQCGGFDFMYIDKIIGKDGVELKEDEYELNNITVNGEDRIEIRYEHSPGGKYYNNEDLTWKVVYKVFGSIGNFDTYDLLYWDSAFADRTDEIENMTIRVHFPKNWEFNVEEDLTVYNDSTYTFENGLLTLIVNEPLPMYDPNTILLKFPKGIVNESATLIIEPKSGLPGLFFLQPDFSIVIDGKKIFNQGNEYKGIPTGTQKIGFDDSGFNYVEKELTFESGEVKKVEVESNPNIFSIIIYFAIVFCNLIGLCLIPFAVLFPILRWYRKGRDPKGRGIIVPWFSPPEEMSPTLLGSLKDEKVDMVDISATIIDSAFKGYIKIVELDKKGKEFEFVKLRDFFDLPIEQKKIMDDIFSYATDDKVKTTKLKNTFYTKIKEIQTTIYDEMMNKKYFIKRPDKVRDEYVGTGVLALVGGGVLIGIIVFLTNNIGFIVMIFPIIAIALFGIITLVLSTHMPAKTESGVKVLERIKGFKMYMETAEKYRVQNLTPEIFEKYLSYAIVFGIEKSWANKFKGIYNGQPSWYESSTGMTDVWTPIYLANSLSRMNTVTSSTIASTPQSSGSGSSGGGWSGGGGFSGGFSGGGGGGGGGGSW